MALERIPLESSVVSCYFGKVAVLRHEKMVFEFGKQGGRRLNKME